MKLVFTSYKSTQEYTEPEEWLKRIHAYTGILEHLAKEHEVESIEQINYEGRLKRNRVQYHFIRLKNPDSYFPFHHNRYVRKSKPGFVFVNGFIFPLQIIQLKVIAGRRVKLIVINRSEKPGRGIMGFFQKLADRFVSYYLFASKEQGMDWVKRGIISNGDKIAEIMGASSSFQFMNREEAQARTAVKGDPVFLWVGRLDSNKDPMTAIKAFEAFLIRQPSAKLCMIFHTEELKAEIISHCKKNSTLQHAVELVGKVPHKELQYWFSSADFIISSSHYEGGGVAVCEAMSCGCIPILSNIPSFRKMTGPDNCGFLYEPGNVDALLKVLLQTRELNIEEEKRKVLLQFRNELSFEAKGNKINNIIRSSLSS